MKTFRMSHTLAVTLVLALVIGLIAPQQLPVTLYKLSLITLAAVAGYYLDRELFPYARPDRYLSSLDLDAVVFCVPQIRRAMIVSACVIAVALGA